MAPHKVPDLVLSHDMGSFGIRMMSKNRRTEARAYWTRQQSLESETFWHRNLQTSIMSRVAVNFLEVLFNKDGRPYGSMNGMDCKDFDKSDESDLSQSGTYLAYYT